MPWRLLSTAFCPLVGSFAPRLPWLQPQRLTRCVFYIIPFVSPHTSTTSSIKLFLKFYHTLSTSPGFCTTNAALICTSALKILAVTSSFNVKTLLFFHKFHFTLIQISRQIQNTNALLFLFGIHWSCWIALRRITGDFFQIIFFI